MYVLCLFGVLCRYIFALFGVLCRKNKNKADATDATTDKSVLNTCYLILMDFFLIMNALYLCGVRAGEKIKPPPMMQPMPPPTSPF